LKGENVLFCPHQRAGRLGGRKMIGQNIKPLLKHSLPFE
jgi:hypothetical protein